MAAPEGIVTVQIGIELLAAARKYAAVNGVELSTLIRRGLAREVGQRQLAATVKRGRPKKVAAG